MKTSPAGPSRGWLDVHGTAGRMLVEWMAGCRGMRTWTAYYKVDLAERLCIGVSIEHDKDRGSTVVLLAADRLKDG